MSEADKLKEICLTSKDIIPHADRISLWLFSEQFDALHCLICLDEAQQYSSGQVLRRDDYASYFDYIMENQVLKASNATTHPATQCFNHGYFDVYNIHSLLDYIYYDDFKPTGVICCEKVDSAIEWNDSDVDSLRRISSIISMFLNSDEKNRLARRFHT